MAACAVSFTSRNKGTDDAASHEAATVPLNTAKARQPQHADPPAARADADRAQTLRAVQSRPDLGRAEASAMTGFHTTQPVRLTAEQRAAQPEIGAAIGTVRAIGDRWVEVDWPLWRSWVRVEDVEPVT
jgi:hypothetical protein